MYSQGLWQGGKPPRDESDLPDLIISFPPQKADWSGGEGAVGVGWVGVGILSDLADLIYPPVAYRLAVSLNYKHPPAVSGKLLW